MSKPVISAKVRKLIVARVNGRCEYCRANAKYADSPFDIDHIIPRSLGGLTQPDNLALACHGCNLYKANRVAVFDPYTGSEVTFFNPRNQAWGEHFAWSSDGSLIVGLTWIGRVTIDALRLNRVGVVNQRIVLTELGLHP